MLVTLPLVGGLALTFSNSAQSYLQLRAEPWVRGRVMGLYTLVFMGGTPLGAPLIGWTADHFGPRYGLIGGGVGTLLTVGVCVAIYLRSVRVSDELRDPHHAIA
jgi:MFS family permease